MELFWPVLWKVAYCHSIKLLVAEAPHSIGHSVVTIWNVNARKLIAASVLLIGDRHVLLYLTLALNTSTPKSENSTLKKCKLEKWWIVCLKSCINVCQWCNDNYTSAIVSDTHTYTTTTHILRWCLSIFFPIYQEIEVCRVQMLFWIEERCVIGQVFIS